MDDVENSDNNDNRELVNPNLPKGDMDNPEIDVEFDGELAIIVYRDDDRLKEKHYIWHKDNRITGVVEVDARYYTDRGINPNDSEAMKVLDYDVNMKKSNWGSKSLKNNIKNIL